MEHDSVELAKGYGICYTIVEVGWRSSQSGSYAHSFKFGTESGE